VDNAILAHLGGRLTRQQELLATEGLAYLLARSEACVAVLRRSALAVGCMLPEALRFRVEVAGTDLERPDIVGTDGDNVEALIIEGKFDAGLTDNQPNAYLGRLGSELPGMLLFVVPDLRVPRLWREITARVGMVAPGDGIWSVALGDGRFLGIISWRALLDLMLHAAVSGSDPVAADIRQLQNLCQRFEGEAFLPFDAEELSSIRLPRRHRDLCDVVDGIVDTLVACGTAKLDGLRATPQRNGYVRYVWLSNNRSRGGAMIALNYDAWRTWEVSPLWLAPQSNSVGAQRAVLERLALETCIPLFSTNGKPMLPLVIDPGLERDEVIARCATTVRTLSERLAAAAVDGTLA
jgi:hypothetical protein